MAAKVKFTLNLGTVKATEEQLTTGLIALGEAVATAEAKKAPFDTGHLVLTIRSEQKSATEVEVIAGGNYNGYQVPYAYRRNFENNLHPGTKHFAQNGLREVVNGGIGKYFKVGSKA